MCTGPSYIAYTIPLIISHGLQVSLDAGSNHIGIMQSNMWLINLAMVTVILTFTCKYFIIIIIYFNLKSNGSIVDTWVGQIFKNLMV